ICCILQFAIGQGIGSRYDDRITCGQSFGQKNTVFLIWMASTFLTPITAVVGGLYSIWHNIVNSWQLYKHK
ncbi:MAG: transporter, partial [Bacteroidales bacterium]|nr:transporter [Bacteroidales bacterium]